MWPKTKKQASLVNLAKEIAKEIEVTAPEYDRNATFPHKHFELMREKGYLGSAVPTSNGGAGHGLTDLVLAQYEIGRGDGSTAVSVGMHHMIIGAEIETRTWPDKLRQQLFTEIAGYGVLINSISSEPGLGSPRGGGRPATTLQEETDGQWLLNGRKTWSTMAPALTYAVVYVAFEDGSEDTGRILLRMNSKGVAIEETWDSMSMRSTGSHDIVFNDVLVEESEFLMRTNSQAPPGDAVTGAAWFPLLLSSANLGIAHAARDYAINFAKTRKPTGATGPISRISHVREQIARMESMLLIARRSLFSCAEDWEHYPNERKDLLPEVSVTKIKSVDSAIGITDLAMRIVGGIGLERNRPLERYFRDARSGIANPPIEARALEQLASKILDN